MKVEIKAILAAVARDAGLDVSDLTAPNRRPKVVRARHIAWWLCRRLRPDVSLPQLGRLAGGFDHTSVLHGVAVVDELRRLDADIREDVDQLLLTVSPAGAPPRVGALDTLTARLVAAALDDGELLRIATHAGVDPEVAHERLTEIAEACAAAIGRGLIWAELYSHKPDALLDPEPVHPAVVALATPAETAAPVPPAPPPPPQLPAPAPAAPRPREAFRDELPKPLVRRPGPPSRSLVSAPVTKPRPRSAAPGFFSGYGRAPEHREVQKRTDIDAGDRALIDAAIAAGKVRQVSKDDGTELVWDPDHMTHRRLPRSECELVPGGWRKRPSKAVLAKAARAGRANAAGPWS